METKSNTPVKTPLSNKGDAGKAEKIYAEVVETNRTSPSKKGDAVKAALLSALVVPGAGQMYNKQWGKGLFILFTFLLASLGALLPITLIMINYSMNLSQGNLDAATASLNPMKDVQSRLIVLISISMILYIYSIVDSYWVRKNRKQ